MNNYRTVPTACVFDKCASIVERYTSSQVNNCRTVPTACVFDKCTNIIKHFTTTQVNNCHIVSTPAALANIRTGLSN